MKKFMYRGSVKIQEVRDGTKITIMPGDIVAEDHVAIQEGWPKFVPVNGGEEPPETAEEASTVTADDDIRMTASFSAEESEDSEELPSEEENDE